jgi:hypothetical protein
MRWYSSHSGGCDRPTRLADAKQGNLPIREILKRMRHDGCGGRRGRAELLTGAEGVSSRQVRKIALRSGT